MRRKKKSGNLDILTDQDKSRLKESSITLYTVIGLSSLSIGSWIGFLYSNSPGAVALTSGLAALFSMLTGGVGIGRLRDGTLSLPRELRKKAQYLATPKIIHGILMPAPSDIDWKFSLGYPAGKHHYPDKQYEHGNFKIIYGDNGRLIYHKNTKLPLTSELLEYITHVREYQDIQEEERKLVAQQEQERLLLEEVARDSWQ